MAMGEPVRDKHLEKIVDVDGIFVARKIGGGFAELSSSLSPKNNILFYI